MKIRNKKGITLIALVVTIIILLILAATSIAMLTGENGIISQAQNAKNNSKKADFEERVKLAVTAARINKDGTIDLGELDTELKNAGITNIDKKGENEGLPWIVEENGFTYEITEDEEVIDGTIKKNLQSVTVEEIADNPDKYYGQVVKNYTAGGATYRIFYVDTENKYGDGKNTVYLKADCDPNKITTLDNYASYNKTTTKVREMNPGWAAQRGTATWYENEQAAAWLCTPETGENEGLLWSEYYDSSKANYVIGGPSVEMYCDSYNSVEHPGVTNYRLEAQCRATSYPGYIYIVNETMSTISNSDYETGTDTVDYKNYGSMYCGKDGAKGGYYWWLASPSSIRGSHECYVDSSNAALNYSYCNDMGDLSPLISLRSDFTIQIER